MSYQWPGNGWGYIMLIHFLHSVPVCCLSFNFVESHLSATSLISGDSCSTHMTCHIHHVTPSSPSGNPKPKDEDSKYLLSCQGKPQKPDVSRFSEAAKNVNTSAPHHHSSFKLSKNLSKAKFELSRHHPWDTFYCLSSIFNRLPHLKQMGIPNSQSPSSSEAWSLLRSRKACVHRFGCPKWLGFRSNLTC